MLGFESRKKSRKKSRKSIAVHMTEHALIHVVCYRIGYLACKHVNSASSAAARLTVCSAALAALRRTAISF